jgi:hypothetical protein
MLAGPRVDIFVGPRKKHYLLPKLLLCYYSPFFEKYFNDLSNEGQTQQLELFEDRVEFFEIMIEFMLHGKVENVRSFHKFNLNSTAMEDKKEFIEFIKYNDKYGLGEISNEAQQEFSKALGYLVTKVDVSDIEVVFGALPAGSPLRTLLVRKIHLSNTFEDTQKFRSQEHSIPGYAAEVLDYLRANFDVTMKRGKSRR